MNKKQKLSTLISTLILIIGIFLLNQFVFPRLVIKDLYSNPLSTTFVSNWEIIGEEDFWKNKDYIYLGNNRYSVVYEGEDYKNFNKVILGDLITLKRKNILWWEIAKYETTYLPYYDNEDISFDEMYADYIEDIKDGTVSKGLTPDQERALPSSQAPRISPGDIVDFFSNEDESVTIEVVAGEKYGQTKLVLGSTGEDLGIENPFLYAISPDGQSIVYVEGEFIEPLGDIVPTDKLWIVRTDLIKSDWGLPLQSPDYLDAKAVRFDGAKVVITFIDDTEMILPQLR